MLLLCELSSCTPVNAWWTGIASSFGWWFMSNNTVPYVCCMTSRPFGDAHFDVHGHRADWNQVVRGEIRAARDVVGFTMPQPVNHYPKTVDYSMRTTFWVE